MAIRTREIYRSANGDRWLLAIDSDTGRVFVRHEPNLPSGGQVADIEIGAFLIAAGNGPEKQELLRLIGTLVRARMPRGPKGVPMLVGAACSRQCERWVYERDFKDALSPAALNKPPILRSRLQRLPSANGKCLFNSFLNVGNKLLVA